jgi:hypothetical protein
MSAAPLDQTILSMALATLEGIAKLPMSPDKNLSASVMAQEVLARIKDMRPDAGPDFGQPGAR